MRSPRTFLAAALAALLALPAAAQPLVYLAFGDSITFGTGDPGNPPGYPPRLERLLADEGVEAVVENHGEPSEDTFGGLARLSGVLDRGGDGLLLMEGTNDVPLLRDGEVSIETVMDNLDRMAAMANGRGITPVHASIIPRRRSRDDLRNVISQRVAWEIRELAIRKNRALADTWEAFDPAAVPDAFSTLYANLEGDGVGHPNEPGYDKMAAVFADVLLDRDTVPPVPGVMLPGLLPDEIEVGTEIRATVLEPRQASGIQLRQTALLINGREVASPLKSSNRRRAEMVFDGDPGCRAEVAVRSNDRADPPNVIERRIKVYDILDRTPPTGDADSDCRVVGADLVRLALAFGAMEGEERYDALADFNGDGEVDGRDLARLADNFGTSSL